MTSELLMFALARAMMADPRGSCGDEAMRFECEVGVWRYIGTVEETPDGIRVSDFLVFNKGVPHEMDSEEYDEAEGIFLHEYWRQK